MLTPRRRSEAVSGRRGALCGLIPARWWLRSGMNHRNYLQWT
jgi:hypothetical protein